MYRVEHFPPWTTAQEIGSSFVQTRKGQLDDAWVIFSDQTLYTGGKAARMTPKYNSCKGSRTH